MSIRSLDLLDLPLIARYRKDTLMLDSARALTRGHPLRPMGFLSYFNPARHLYAAVAKENGTSVLGGIIHTRGDTFAKLHYLTPSSQLEHPQLPALVEHLAEEAGRWGVFHVLAEVDETSDAFPILRRAGFSVYAWQRMWDVSNLTEASPGCSPAKSMKGELVEGSDWRRARSVELHAIQSLYYQIVPPLMHPVEPAPRIARGFVCGDGIRSYAIMSSGAAGIIITPLIHPEMTRVSERLCTLAAQMPERRSRPVYLCIRSYQTWLEPVLEDVGALAGPRQAVMVKRLARLVLEEQTVPAVPSGARVQPSQAGRMHTDE